MDRILLSVKKGEKRYKLLYLQLRKDNSFYVYFPRKQGYLIKHGSDIKDFVGEKQISLEKNIREKIYNPYISFHPGKNTVHINARGIDKQEIHFLSDRFTEKMSDAIARQEFIPFSTILFPDDIKIFDELNNKPDNLIEFNRTENISNPEHLNLEIFLHGIGGYVSPEEIKFKEIRKIIKIIPIYNKHANPIVEASLVFSAIPPTTDNKKTKEIVSFIWNKETPFVFCLKPTH